MARKKIKSVKTKTAPKKQQTRNNVFSFAQKSLILLGKPLFIILEYSIIGLLLFLSFIGQTPKILANLTEYGFKKSKKKISSIILNIKSITKKIVLTNKKLKKKTTKTKKTSKAKRKIKKVNFNSQISVLFNKIFKLLKSKKSKRKSKNKSFTFVFPKFSLPHFSIPKFKYGGNVSWKIFSFTLLLLVGFLTFYSLILKDLPSATMLVSRNQEVSTKIYDRNGVLLYKIYKNKNRTPVELAQIPVHVRYATLAAEDAEFYSHPGFSVRGIIRSVYKNATKGNLSGGSTLTQQLVKNALLTPEKTFTRKIKEIILSIETETTYSKDQILEMYLNEVSYGGSAYGIQEASHVYFGKSVENLSLREAALLAGLPKSPTRFNPFGSNPENAIQRQKDVLNLMVVNKFITQEQADSAMNEEIKFAENKIDIKAPHFVMHVKDHLAAKYGDEMVEEGGLEVHTTLDYEIQKLAEGAVKKEVDKLVRLHVTNGAALVTNPQTGEVLAMVGSKDYFDIKNDGNVNVTTRPRAPGSSIKVLNYALGLQNRKFTPGSIIPDTPTIFPNPGTAPYTPKNYDGKFRGNITLRSALAESRNIPAVKVLQANGVSQMIELGEKMGITTWGDRSRFGLSLTLGGGEVKMTELSQVFATIANYGKKPELLTITEVKNYKGQILEQNKPKTTEVLDPRVAYQLIDILKDNSARAPAFGSNSALVVNRHPEIPVKTGTSNDLRDNWTVGFSQNYLVAVWIGNNDNSPIYRNASGITGAAPIWNNIISSLLADQPSKEWEVPEGLVKIAICPLTGTLPCQGCGSKPEWFMQESAPKFACRKETIDKINEEKNKKQEISSQPVGQLLPQAARTTY